MTIRQNRSPGITWKLSSLRRVVCGSAIPPQLPSPPWHTKCAQADKLFICASSEVYAATVYTFYARPFPLRRPNRVANGQQTKESSFLINISCPVCAVPGFRFAAAQLGTEVEQRKKKWRRAEVMFWIATPRQKRALPLSVLRDFVPMFQAIVRTWCLCRESKPRWPGLHNLCSPHQVPLTCAAHPSIDVARASWVGMGVFGAVPHRSKLAHDSGPTLIRHVLPAHTLPRRLKRCSPPSRKHEKR